MTERDLQSSEDTGWAGPQHEFGSRDGGWVEAVIPIEGTEQACGELLRLGADVEVVAPAELRQAMAATVEVLARAYERH
ncbi:WYL domain-containing protein [Streptomyces sp. NPDC101166]|uniref:WYL domain-containing protein n=1 Tax=Streptomyces sp. NPDC101166 TaxID=3366120 RepID=UPI0037F926A8